MTEDIKRANMQVENCLVSVTESSSMHQKSLAIALSGPAEGVYSNPPGPLAGFIGDGKGEGKRKGIERGKREGKSRNKGRGKGGEKMEMGRREGKGQKEGRPPP